MEVYQYMQKKSNIYYDIQPEHNFCEIFTLFRNVFIQFNEVFFFRIYENYWGEILWEM